MSLVVNKICIILKSGIDLKLMSWIKSIAYNESTGKLRKIFDRIKGPSGYIDNILKIHGLRPHTLEGHMALYKNVLHHSGNVLPVSFLETLGVYISLLNGCNYCVRHHYEGMKKQMKDDQKANQIYEALVSDEPQKLYHGKDLALIRYAKKLALYPANMNEKDINVVKENGGDDGEILEVNQVVSYFSYANRTVLGLGVSTEGDVLGLSPNDQDNEENWSHS